MEVDDTARDDTDLQQVALDETIAAHAPSNETPGSLTAASQRRTQIEQGLAAESANALVHEERERTRQVALFMAGLGLFAAAGLTFFGGTLWVKRLLQGSLAFGILSMLWLWWRAAHHKAVDDWRANVAWAIGFFCTCANTMYFGAYSPAPAIMVMAVVIFSMGRSRALAITLYALAALTEASISILDATGLMDDPGILTASGLTTVERIAGQVLVQSLLIAGFWLGRSSRRATTEAIAKMQDALREVARREVIAHEAQDKVRRALNIGGAGRYSSATFGNYLLSELIGHGGMGEVYRATNRQTNQAAAVKVIHNHLLRDEQFLLRFLREAKLSATANSPYIVSILETGQTDEGPYLAMELLEGIDLSGYLSAHADSLMTLDQLQCLATQVGEGLDAAAKAGIVHRDIKPQNIFLSGGVTNAVPPLHCKILDFGVARATSADATVTRGSSLLGTPAYMAPEQALGIPADHRADLHALVAVLYRAGTGLQPFTGENAHAVMLKVSRDMPPPASQCGLPAALDAFFEKGFAKDPEKRYQSGADLSRAFASACARAA